MIKPGEGNPWGEVVAVGGQFTESRGIERMYGGNPYAQSRLLEVLVGLHRTATEHYFTSIGEGFSQDEAHLAANAIAKTMRFFDKQFPTWREESFEPDSEFMLPTYRVDEHLLHWVDDIIGTIPEGEG